MLQKSCIEILKVNGILRRAFVTNEATGARLAELPLRGFKEEGAAGGMGIVTLELNSIRVIHTETNT